MVFVDSLYRIIQGIILSGLFKYVLFRHMWRDLLNLENINRYRNEKSLSNMKGFVARTGFEPVIPP